MFSTLNEWWLEFYKDFYQTFIENDRWQFFTSGVVTTLKVTALSLILGVVIGVVIAVIRSSYDSNSSVKKNLGLSILNRLAKIYLTIIRGTPVMVQILIMNFVIMRPQKEDLIWCACITFGINSGAYVAEIIRSGIMSIDIGQMEAGRSLGLNYVTTMRKIIIPQAVKNILPALGNEFITLLKETSIVTVIGLTDLTKAAQIVQGITYQAYMPYIAIALIYLVLIFILSSLLNVFERRLRKSDRG